MKDLLFQGDILAVTILKVCHILDCALSVQFIFGTKETKSSKN